MTTTSDGPPNTVAIRVHGVTKRYGTVTALDRVDLAVRRGTVHGLVGENGSGKSTLMKVIAGVETPDAGSVTLGGENLERIDPREAIRHGVRVIFQDLALFPNMSVAENLVYEGDRPLLRPVHRREQRRRAGQALDALGLRIPLRARLGDLSTAERQLVAIARTVSSEARVVLMDEPTASLTQEEIDRLLQAVRRLSEGGISFVFISHKLREVIEVADDVTVIRDGRIVSTGHSSDYDTRRISELMTGGVLDERRHSTPRTSEVEPVVSVRGLTLRSRFRDIDLDLHAGRVLGLAGLVGSGRIEIGQALVGLIRAERGEVRYRGRVLRNRRRAGALQYVPDDRLTEGLFLDWSIAENVVLNTLASALGRRRTVSGAGVRRVGEKWRERLRIKASDAGTSAATLSGGNQQRVLLARALAPEPDVVVLNNPTVGVDVGSRADIHDLVRAEADRGTAILLISDEPAELLGVCDDLVFIHQGRVVARRDAKSLDETGLLDLIAVGGEAA